MPWMVKKISSHKERAADAVRVALSAAQAADINHGRGYGAVASAIEAALGAFGDINGYSIEIDTSGDIGPDGRGFLTISLHTIAPDVIVS